MPNGGQIPSGSGLRLQASSPGAIDPGNFNISGIGRSTGGVLGATGPYPDPANSSALCAYGLYSTFRFTTTNGVSSCVVGNGVTLGSLVSGDFSTTLDQVLVGNAVQVGMRGCVVIGAAASADSGAAVGGSSTGYHVVIGRAAGTSSDIANNRGINVGLGANGTWTGGCITGIGGGQSILNKIGPSAKGGIYIGQYIKSTAGANQIIIDSSSTGTGLLADETRFDLIKIGDASHTIVEIGGRSLPISFNYYGNQNVALTYSNSVAEFTIVSMVPVVRSLSSSSQIRINGEGFISCVGTPTLQLKVKWGIGALVLITSSAAALPAGLSNAPFKISFALRVTSNPSAATPATGTGTMDIWTGTQWFSIPIFMTASTNIDTQVVNNASNGIWISAIWGTAAVGNTLTINSASTEGRFNYQ